MQYSIHPSIAYVSSIVRNLKTTSGLSLGEWHALIKKEKLVDPKQIKEFLNQYQELGASKKSIVIDSYLEEKKPFMDSESYLQNAPIFVEKMLFTKPNLKPLFDHIISLTIGHFPEAKICPCETIVPVYRTHVIAQLKPATKDRLELGFALKKFKGKISDVLVSTGGLEKGDRITHKLNCHPNFKNDSLILKWMELSYTLDDANDSK